MKDYSLRNEKIKLIHAMAMSIGEDMTELFENGYDQGCVDGQKEKLANAMIHDHEEAEKKAYEDGMNAAWEAVSRIIEPVHDGGYDFDALHEIFGEAEFRSIFKHNTASEVIAKIKAYEDKQKCKECKKTKDPIFYGHCVGECDYAKQTEDEIKVGDEVIVQVDRVGFVTGYDVFSDRVFVTTKYGWSDAFKRSFVKKTGRHFPQIAKVLAELRGAE